MQDRVDLHLHTHHSDGRLSPAELIRLAARGGVRIASVTDHDTLDGTEAAEAEAEAHAIRLIPGVEVSVNHEGEDLHILGYFVDRTNPALLELLGALGRERRTRLRGMIERLARLGMPLTESEVIDTPGRIGSIGRPHLAAALYRRGWIGRPADAFRYHIGEGCPAYLPKRTETIGRTIEILRQAGGLSVLAHPGAYQNWGRLLEQLVPAGLSGLEVYHPSHQPEQIALFEGAARRWNLAATGGSDYHGNREGEMEPGSLPLGPEIVERLEARRMILPEPGRIQDGVD